MTTLQPACNMMATLNLPTHRGCELLLGQTSLPPNPGQPPTKHSAQLIQLRLLVHHAPADKEILQIVHQPIKPILILTSSLVVSY
jgi:hypothetical protein